MTLKPATPPRGRMHVSKKNLLWSIPLTLAIVVIAAILALPGFVSSGYHRATIENLASSLTGRTVHINGKLSLALLPHPQFIAGDVTITSPNQETITAASLTLDIATVPLLHGEISARSIMLQSPHIVLPWPLPGGAAAIAPPLWLTTLHAQISNGEVSLGAAKFTQVSADIFTGGQGTFSVSGTGNLNGAPIMLSLSFAPLSAAGSAPLALEIQITSAAKLMAHISGTFDASSTLAGNASFSAATLGGLDPSLKQPLSGTAAITADPQQILLSNLKIEQGAASLAGTATIRLPHPAVSLLLTGKNLTIPSGIFTTPAALPALPTHLTLDASNTTIAANPALTFAHLQTSVDFDAGGARIEALTMSVPGAGLAVSGNIDAAGNLQADASFSSTDLNSLGGFAFPADWATANVRATLSGTADHLTLGRLNGSFGPAKVTGGIVLTHRSNINGELHFDQLDLSVFAALLGSPPSLAFAPGLSGDLEVTADRAGFGKVRLTHLLADASLSNQLVVRRLSASIYGGIADASFALSPGKGGTGPAGGGAAGQITSARAILAFPSAAPVAGLLPTALHLPPAVTKAPLSLSFLAAGPANALATSASLTLGDISITASPVIDLVNQTASGAFTLRHPSAINALKAFGLNAGLAWPGAGSIALRADLVLSASRMGLSNFVLSMGDLTSNGQLIYGDHQLNGQIDADTLALPPLPAKFTPPWAMLTNIQGKIGITANRVLLAGNQILGPGAAMITLSPGKLDFSVAQAALADGSVKGDFLAMLPATAPFNPGQPAQVAPPPAITAKFTVAGAEASAFDLPLKFPLTLPSGTIDAAADLTASGYAPAAWLATLSGNFSLAASAGSLKGFDLPALQAALTAPTHRASQLHASLAGVTPFTSLNLTSTLNSGIATLDNASLQSPTGTATATGNIDLPDTGITITLTLRPAVPAPPSATLTLDGSWASPRKIPALKPAQDWKPPPK